MKHNINTSVTSIHIRQQNKKNQKHKQVINVFGPFLSPTHGKTEQKKKNKENHSFTTMREKHNINKQRKIERKK